MRGNGTATCSARRPGETVAKGVPCTAPAPVSRALVASLCLLCLVGCSSAANRRVLKDVAVVGAALLQIPAGGVQDTVQVCWEYPWATLCSPLVLVHQTAKHTLICLVHGGDVLFYPVALRKGWEPMDLYDTTTFPFAPEEEGEELIDRAYFLVGGVAIVAATVYGACEVQSQHGPRSDSDDAYDFVVLPVGLGVGAGCVYLAFSPDD